MSNVKVQQVKNTTNKADRRSTVVSPKNHPLATMMSSFSPSQRAEIEAGMRKLEERQAEHLRDGKYSNYLNCFPEEARLEPFIEIIPRLSDSQYWSLLRDVWTTSELIIPDMHTWLDLYQAKRPGREHLMTDGERHALAAMPEVITIWRGCGYRSAVGGLSWTTDQDRADVFARIACGSRRRLLTGQAGTEPTVAVGTCRRADVLAYITGCQESEIVVDPKNVTLVRTYQVPKDSEPDSEQSNGQIPMGFNPVLK